MDDNEAMEPNSIDIEVAQVKVRAAKRTRVTKKDSPTKDADPSAKSSANHIKSTANPRSAVGNAEKKARLKAAQLSTLAAVQLTSPEIMAQARKAQELLDQLSAVAKEHDTDQLLETVAVNKAEFSIEKAPDSGIEILVKMAEKGEIDPKNVDIVDVCDKFLKAIAATPKESLRMSGKVIFHAAVLLRMKAEALLSFASSQVNPVADDFLDFDDEGGPILYDSNKQEVGRQLTFKDLEGAIVRRAQRKVVTRERRVTLEQLIQALREAEKLEKVRQEKKPKAARIDLSDHHQVNEYDDILDLAHDEDIEETIVKVEQWICENLSTGQNIELFELVIRLSKKDWVEAFLAALFLSNAGKIDLEQESFYGPLYLSLCTGLSNIISDTVAAS